MKRIINAILLISCLCCLSLSAKTVKLTVMSKGNDVPLPATVILESKNGEVRNYKCDRAGAVSIVLPDTLTGVSLEITHENCLPAFCPVPDGDKDISLGTVELQSMTKELKEVVVNADGIVYRAGTTVIIPSETEKKRNFNTGQLIRDLGAKVPGLEYNDFLRQVSVNNENAVILINGRRKSTERLIGLSPERIQKIEVVSYRDMKYDAPVVSITLNPSDAGGSASAYTQQAVTTPKNYSQASAFYNCGKSEFSFNYDLIYRYSTKEYNNEWNEYIAPDYTIKQTMTGLPSTTNDQDHKFQFDYAYIASKNTLFAVTGDFELHRHTETSRFENRQVAKGEETVFNTTKRNHYLRTPFTLTAYFRHKTGKHLIELNSSMSSNTADYDRGLNYSNGYSNQTENHNTGLASKSDITYTVTLSDVVRLETCGLYDYTRSKSRLTQNGEAPTLTDVKRHRGLGYGKLSFNFSNTSMSVYAGVNYIRDISTYTDDRWTYRTSANINQSLGRNCNLSYSFSLSQITPSLANYSTVRQILNDFSVHVGNPDLRTSFSQTHKFQMVYKAGKVRFSPSANLSHYTRPLMTEWRYSKDEDLFIRTTGNGKKLDILRSGMTVSASNLLNKINLSAKLEYNHIWAENQTVKMDKGAVGLSFDGNAYFGNLNVGFSYIPVIGISPRNDMSYHKSAAYNTIYANYRYRSFQFGARWQFPFTKRACYQETRFDSPIAPSYTDYSINDFSNMILFTVQYRLNFGKKAQKTNINFQRTGTVTDVITEY